MTFFTWLKRYFWKLLSVMLVALFAYGLYLDAQIKARFDGNKWVVPAQLYARPLTMQVGQDLRLEEVLQELDILGYRKVTKPSQSGEYSVTRNDIHIIRRSFAFAEGFEPEKSVTLSLRHGKLVNIRDNVTTDFIQSIRLEPLMVSRITTQSFEDRMLVTLDDVPKHLITALLHTEDRDFYNHFGVAPLAIVRALIANVQAGKTVQGGSTLTQQLAKNLFLTRERSLVRKANEAIMAVIMEIRYSKDEILETYINEVFLGQKGELAIHGFGLASYYYFNRPINELNVAESAILVGMVKGPSLYNPFRRPERAMARRDLILRTLMDDELISLEHYQASVNAELNVTNQGLLVKHKYPAFMDAVNRELRATLMNPDIRDSGVKIFSTLDPFVQRAAEQAVEQRLPQLKERSGEVELNTAVIASAYRTGEIRAIVGGKDFNYRGFNRVLDANRPIGSLIKPAVYLTALEDAGNYNLATPIEDLPITLSSTHGKQWQPQNVDKKFRGTVSLLSALTQSLNVPTVKLGMDMGLENVTDTLYRLGVKKSVEAYPAITLGAVNLSPFRVNQIYQTIANQGSQQKLHAITAITSHDDQVIWLRTPSPEQTVDPQAAYLTNYALHKVTREGTGRRLKQAFPDINLAGKTGTTDDYRDSWFTGIDSQLVTSIWVGNDDNLETNLTGSAGAMSVYIDVQKQIQPRSFAQAFPEGVHIAHFNPNSGVHQQAGCQISISVPAILDALPTVMGCDGQIPPEPEEEKSFWDRFWGNE